MVKKILSIVLVLSLAVTMLTLSVSAAANTEITVKLNATSVTIRGTTETYKFTATTNSSRAVTWASDNEEVATVDQNGLVKPLKAGTVHITASVERVSATARVSVENRGNSTGNITNGGLAAISGDWIYYAGNDDKLYKIRTNGTGKTKLSDDKARFINVINGYVYYSNESDMKKAGVTTAGKLYRIKTDGTGREMLSEDATEDINVVGNIVYYIGSNTGITKQIFRINTNGTSRTVLRRDGPNYGLAVVGGQAYYTRFSFSNPTGDYKFKISARDGTGGVKAVEDKLSNASLDNSFQIIGSWIYYSGRGDRNTGLDNFYRVKTDGTGRELLLGDGWNWIGRGAANVVGNSIFFADNKNGRSLYRIGLDGQNKTRLTNDRVHQICVVGSWIYYMDDKDDIFRVRTNGNDRQKV